MATLPFPNDPPARKGIVRWIGGTAREQAAIRSDFDLIRLGEEGLTKAAVAELAAYLGLSRKEMAEDILDISVKTVERKGPTDRLDKRTSSHALEIARLLEHAWAVFEDVEAIREWLNRPNRALKGHSPVSLLDTLTGIKMVDAVLGRIEEGVYS